MKRRLVVTLAACAGFCLAGCSDKAANTPNPDLEIPKSTSKPGDAKAARGGHGPADGAKSRG